ncbi:hypothetical protein C7293_13705 [filamentous cyanobacterium CCT1]|nr:hypothetical protein C7293_13705 [filamentous cyanobacterium CCT1]
MNRFILPLLTAAAGLAAGVGVSPHLANAPAPTAIAPAVAQDEVTEAAPTANWNPGELWALYQEDWAFTLPAEYQGKAAGTDYHFVETGKPLRHSAYLIDGLADGLRDGWTSMSDEVAAFYPDGEFHEHPEPALQSVQPWKIDGDRAAKILNHGAARAVVLADGTILRHAEVEARKAELLSLTADGFCMDWTATLFEPGSRIEFQKDGAIHAAPLDEACYPAVVE